MYIYAWNCNLHEKVRNIYGIKLLSTVRNMVSKRKLHLCWSSSIGNSVQCQNTYNSLEYIWIHSSTSQYIWIQPMKTSEIHEIQLKWMWIKILWNSAWIQIQMKFIWNKCEEIVFWNLLWNSAKIQIPRKFIWNECE